MCRLAFRHRSHRRPKRRRPKAPRRTENLYPNPKMQIPRKKNSSRREFLRRLSVGTAAVATGIGFAGCKQSTPSAATVPPVPKVTKDGKKKLGIALLGLG